MESEVGVAFPGPSEGTECRSKLLPERSGCIAESAERDALLAQIHEVLPGYGKGFLAACLDAAGQDAERVIHQLLEGSLPGADLLSGLCTAICFGGRVVDEIIPHSEISSGEYK